MKKRLKVNGVIIFLAVVLLAVFPAVFIRQSQINWLDEFAEIAGIALILLGQLVRVSARGYKAEHSSDGASLIQGGPYALVRNPMYLGILLIGAGSVFMLFKLCVAVIFLAFFAGRYFLLIFKEEQKLRGMFKQEYTDYCLAVPRLFPSLYRLGSGEISAFLPMKTAWIKKEIGSIVAVIATTLLIESWEDIRQEGIRAYFGEAQAIVIVFGLFWVFVWYLNRKTAQNGSNAINRTV